MDRGDNWWWLIIGIWSGWEVGVQKEDLDISCVGGHSEGKGFAGECSLIQHGLPPLELGGITHFGTFIE